jgi:uncharacterized CHY-type Zn-finger protein
MIPTHGPVVLGAVVDDRTRCVHYRSELDIVALRFHCCGAWYPCVHCHDEVVGHARTVWSASDGDVEAALCGECGTTMTISAYRVAETCPSCGAGFNPGCALHHHQYFD